MPFFIELKKDENDTDKQCRTKTTVTAKVDKNIGNKGKRINYEEIDFQKGCATNIPAKAKKS